MKVLWFTFSPSPAVIRKLGQGHSLYKGWVESLRQALGEYHPQIELHIASCGKYEYNSFREGNSIYHCIQNSPSTRLKGILDRWNGTLRDAETLKISSKLVKKIDPDLVHVHGSENPFGFLSSIINSPLLLSIQGILSAYLWSEEQGYTVRERIRDIFRPDFIMGRGIFHGLRKYRMMVKREHKILSSCKHLVGRTDWDRDVSSLINSNAIYYHCDEIMRPPFYQAVRNQSKVEPGRIFATTSASPRKGLIFLLNAVRILKDKGWSSIKLRIAGNAGEGIYLESIRVYIYQNKLENNVVFLGMLNAQEIVEELLQSCLFVHPSLIDNSPNSLAEAMLVGVPCIASRVGGVPSLLKHGKEGLLYNSTDSFELAHCIERVLDDSIFAASLSAQSRETAVKRHSPRRIADQLKEIYSSISINNKEPKLQNVGLD